MTMRAPRVCACGTLVAHGVMCVCQLERQAASKARFDARRPAAHERGYGSKWRAARAEFLARPDNRMCACACGRPSTIVHHKIAHKGNFKIFWDRKLWVPVCQPCHDGPLQSQEKRAQP
jgi:5-methylcytosine-specific restriction endonuclease McrA